MKGKTMKIRNTKILRDGRRHVLVELDPTEALPVAAYKDDAMYRLPYPMDDIVPGRVISDARHVYWCPIGQEWVEA